MCPKINNFRDLILSNKIYFAACLYCPAAIEAMERGYDHLLKLLIIGESGVGKSCIMSRFADDIFMESFISTVGVDFKIRHIRIDDKIVKLQIWDTAGQERFRTIMSSYYRGSHGILIVYDVSDLESFQCVDMWIGEIYKSTATDNVDIFLIGNKCDMKEDMRQVPRSRGLEFAKEHGLSFFETSAKDATNIDLVFHTLAKGIVCKDGEFGGLTRKYHCVDIVNRRMRGGSCC